MKLSAQEKMRMLTRHSRSPSTAAPASCSLSSSSSSSSSSSLLLSFLFLLLSNSFVTLTWAAQGSNPSSSISPSNQHRGQQQDVLQDRLDTSTCIQPPYAVHLFSLDPLVIYIDGFVTADERRHLLETSESAFISSLTADESGSETLRKTRRSMSATPLRDAVTKCIEKRAVDFQGFDTPQSHLEPIQLVRYRANETYHYHTDWFTSPAQTTTEYGGNRLSSFFAYVHVSEDITGGGTRFPLLTAPKDPRWCRFIDCDAPISEGTTFLPIPGNAVYWVNLVQGKGDHRNLHMGEVVTSGEKVGMNIWTREGPLSAKYRGEN